MRWRLALALALAFLATGIYGAYAYVHNYSVYRGFPPPSDPHGVPAGRYVEVNFQSQALGHQDRYMVYEPPGFQQLAARGYRFPVLYLLHGTVSNALHYINVGRVGRQPRRAPRRRPNPAIPHSHARIEVTGPSSTTPSGRTPRMAPMRARY